MQEGKFMAHLERNMVPLYLTEQEKIQLDLYSDILGLSRQKVLEAIIASSLEDLDTMDKIGFLVKEVRLSDQIEMFKNLTRQEINDIAKKYNEVEE
jgi:hypothetical protein